MYINWFPDAFIFVLLKWLKFIGLLEKKKVPTNMHLISDSLFYSFDRQPFSESISHCLNCFNFSTFSKQVFPYCSFTKMYLATFSAFFLDDQLSSSKKKTSGILFGVALHF